MAIIVSYEIQVPANDLKRAGQSTTFQNTIINWPDGTEFTIKQATFAQRYEDGVAKDSFAPVFIDDNGKLLFVKMLVRERVKADGTIISPNGSVNKRAMEIIAANEGKTDQEVLDALFNEFKDKTFVASRQTYAAKGKFGEFPASIINFSFKE